MSTILKAEQELILDTDEIKDSNHVDVTEIILSVELDYLNENLNENIVCPKCKENVEQLDEKLVICNLCNTMVTKDNCKKLGNAIFTTSVNESKIRLNV